MALRSGSIWLFHLVSVWESLAVADMLFVDVAEPGASLDLPAGSVNSYSRTLMLLLIFSFSFVTSSGASRLFSDTLDWLAIGKILSSSMHDLEFEMRSEQSMDVWELSFDEFGLSRTSMGDNRVAEMGLLVLGSVSKLLEPIL